MYAGGPFQNLRLLGIFIFETEILLKLLYQSFYISDLNKSVTIEEYVWVLLPCLHKTSHVSQKFLVGFYCFKLKIILSIFLSWPCHRKGCVLGYRSYDCEVISVFLAVFYFYSLLLFRSVFASEGSSLFFQFVNSFFYF